MALIQEMELQGNWLFRRRGFIPYFILPLLVIAMYGRSDAFLDAEPMETIWLGVCVAVSLLGIVIRGLVIGFVPSDTSGRNTVAQRAGSVNKNGMYSLVRHPLYVGNFLMAAGLALSVKVAWFFLAFALIYWIYYERIMMAEEAYLHGKFGDEYDEWASRTPAFLPDFKKWRKPDMSFSWRMVLRREYPGLLVVVTGFMVFDTLEEILVEGETEHLGMVDIFVAGLFVVGILRLIKKKTHWFDEEDR